ncbi:MAG: helix-hairpin-helix domain-containing protein [Salinivenus sp.]
MPGSDSSTPALNIDVAERFREAADLLEAQEASPFRVRAYRQGASTLTQLDRSVEAIYEQEGREGLEDLPNIGASLTNAIVEMLKTGGRWRFLERLEGTVTPESVFRQVAGLGPELAERIHDALGIDTLEDLEAAAHDGRLAEVEGIGERRLQAVRESVESQLRARRRADGDVPVAELLDVDREYRRKAARGELRRIAPRRFNPEGEAWLPILHTDRDGRHYTALYSNTARAHELDKTDDWVVLYLEDDRQAQWTVVTETSGDLTGRRVVRGREADCRAYYDEETVEN